MTCTPRNRVEILNWRKHGDDESYCRVGAYPAGDARTLIGEIDEQMGITAANRKQWAELGNAELERIAEGKLWYANDYLVFEEGDIIEHNGGKFCIRVEEVKD